MRTWWGHRTPIEKKIGIAITAVIITAVVVVCIMNWRNYQREKEKVEQGVRYLTSLEEQDTKAISNNIKEVRARLGMNLADSDESVIWINFEDSMIMGDSRALGFSFHEFMPEERVLAQGGGKITDVDEYIKQVKTLNPERIFLCYGLNDIGIGFWPEPEMYAEACDERIRLLEEELPDTTVYLNSILPAVGVGLDADPNYPRIGEYNEALKAMCEEKGHHYIDNSQLVEEHSDLYQGDGLHVAKEFYKYWAANMLAKVEE